MGLGFNSNVQVGETLFHVQTEDRGLAHPFVDTLVLCGGQVLHRRSTGYGELLEGGTVDETAVRARVERQHHETLEALRAGSLLLEGVRPLEIAVTLRNPVSWLVAGQASLDIEVCSRPHGKPVACADVEVFIEGAEETPVKFAAQTDAAGRASLRFRMPQLTDQENWTLVIRAQGEQAQDQVRYRLKPKPRPSAPTAR